MAAKAMRIGALMTVLLWATAAAAAEPRVINIGWTGGSSWTALPDRIAAERVSILSTAINTTPT